MVFRQRQFLRSVTCITDQNAKHLHLPLAWLEIRTGTKGRGFFARKNVVAGQLLLFEDRIEEESLPGLAKRILYSVDENLRALYVPENYPMYKAPPDLTQSVSDQCWSKALAQAALNGYLNSEL